MRGYLFKFKINLLLKGYLKYINNINFILRREIHFIRTPTMHTYNNINNINFKYKFEITWYHCYRCVQLAYFSE